MRLEKKIILFSSDFKNGDYVKIGEFKGRIKDITFINLKLITDEGDIVFILNSLIFQKEVINFSKVKTKRIIYDFEIEKSLFPKIRKVEKSILKNLITEFEEIIEIEKNISLSVMEFIDREEYN